MKLIFFFFFFFNDTATTEIYTLSLHDALPIATAVRIARSRRAGEIRLELPATAASDRKSTRLNSSNLVISYAVFCLKKKHTTSNNEIGAATTTQRYERWLSNGFA